MVYGGARVGLMGLLADTVLAAQGEVIGVMPQHLVDREIAHTGLTRLDVVDSMHHRKARMAELADAFLALPGGAGTLEELFEVWTWGQIGLHAKPTVLVDPDGFYQPLLAQLDHMVALGYLGPAHRDALGIVGDFAGLQAFLDHYQHPASKWPTASGTATGGDGSTGHDPYNGTPLGAAEAEMVSVGWLHRRDGQLLGVRTRGRDKFYLPGGKLEPGESPEQALVREVAEELGVTLTHLRPALTVTAPAHGLPVPTRLTMRCYHAAHAGTPRPQQEIEEVAWLNVPNDPRAAPAVRAVLQQLADRDD